MIFLPRSFAARRPGRRWRRVFDLEEWTVSLFTANEAERCERYADAIADAETPPRIRPALNAGPDASGKALFRHRPRTSFLNVKGQGNVYPAPASTRSRGWYSMRTPESHTVTLTPEPGPLGSSAERFRFDVDLVARSGRKRTPSPSHPAGAL